MVGRTNAAATAQPPVEKPTLFAPAITLADSTLTITNPASNGSFVTGYKVYSDGTLVSTTQGVTLDLSTVITDPGDHSVTVKTYGNNFNDSSASNQITYTVVSDLAIFCENMEESGAFLQVQFNGVTKVISHVAPTTISVPKGTSVTFGFGDQADPDWAIYYNGTMVSEPDSFCSYTTIITNDVHFYAPGDDNAYIVTPYSI